MAANRITLDGPIELALDGTDVVDGDGAPEVAGVVEGSGAEVMNVVGAAVPEETKRDAVVVVLAVELAVEELVGASCELSWALLKFPAIKSAASSVYLAK